MALYRDYTKLTEDELDQVNKTLTMLCKGDISATDLLKVPKLYYFYYDLFPNNRLDTEELENKDYIRKITADFKSLLDSAEIIESDIAKFIKEQKAYFIIGSIFSDYNFGHQGAYLFPEFPLSTNYVVDYLLVGKKSGGYEFIFVELEAINENIVNANGSFGTSMRKGLQQIEDWDEWIDANYGNLRSIFGTYKSANQTLPDEFHVLDKSRIHYAVVCGRRHHYKQTTYRKRRSKKLESNINIFHYDNLVDLSLNLNNNY